MKYVPYDKIDRPIRGLVKALNEVGLPTTDSCFGHQGRFNHYFFISIHDPAFYSTNKVKLFEKFAKRVLAATYGGMGKVFMRRTFTSAIDMKGFCVSFNYHLQPDNASVRTDDKGRLIRAIDTTKDFSKVLVRVPYISVKPFHDPSVDTVGIDEKKAAVRFLTRKAKEMKHAMGES